MSVISEFTQPDTEPGYFVEFLDQLDRHAPMRDMRAELVPRMITAPGCKALDLGCGIGGATFLMSDQAGPTGRIAGVDISAALIDVARHRAQGRANLEFHVGDATAIPYADGFFDTAHSERVFLYLPDRLAALRELRRVVKPGGRIWLVDTDIDSTAIYSNRRESTRKMIATLAATMPNPNSGRELPALAKAAGLSDVRVETLAATTPHAWQVHAMGGVLAHAAARGVFEKSELEAWSAEQEALQARGEFFQAWLFVRVSGCG